MTWHAKSIEQVLQELRSDPDRGLSITEAASRLEKYGPNEIRKVRKVSPLRIFLSQFNDFLIYLLLAAAVLSVGLGFIEGGTADYVDAILIVTIVFANGVFGFIQDYRAEKAMESLRALAVQHTRVLRDGKSLSLPATQVVPGDIVLLEEGERVPADARIIECHSLETTEAPLTGESGNVTKGTEPVDEKAPLAERADMVFMQTDVVKGHAKAAVVATGMKTEVGAIASEIEHAEQKPTPFQEEVNRMGTRIGRATLALIAVVALVTYFLTEVGIGTAAMLAITLAVAAVPEGLPAIVTVTLALGSRRMAKERALIRRLLAVESLGSVNVIVTDKTGTLTENKMTVCRIYFSGAIYEVTGEGTNIQGEFQQDGRPVDPKILEPLLKCSACANNAQLTNGPDGLNYRGDPTEIALLVAAAKAGVTRCNERIREIPFDSDRKRMAVVLREKGHTAHMKGAPESVMSRCNRIWKDGRALSLDDETREAIDRQTSEFAAGALRVLACAFKELDDINANDEEIENGMVFLGLEGMMDPPRAEVPEAIQDCRRAGIRVLMVTRDNLVTAKAIGSQLGFSADAALTGNDLDNLSHEALKEAAARVEIFARVSPRHKVKLLRSLQDMGHRVAMTGDGVNDAPALRNANVGVAMGQRGTDVAKEASDVVLQDDNFATLRTAIAEGRTIFENVRKFVTFLLSANAGEIMIVFAGVIIAGAAFSETFSGDTLILTPVMLLWINIVTDGLPALALGTDPKPEGIMTRPPRGPRESLIDRVTLSSIIGIGSAMTLSGLPLYFWIINSGGDIAKARTSLLTFIVLAEIVRLQMIRARYKHPILSNRWLIGAVASSVCLHLLVLYTSLNRFFDFQPIMLTDWMRISIALTAFVFLSFAILYAFDKIHRMRQ